MVTKSPPGSIYPLAECRDKLQIGPRTRVFGDGTSGSSFWKIMAALSVLGQKGFYRRRRGPRVSSISHHFIKFASYIAYMCN